ncbi:MAG TPA: gephyrin-like molybdotransferase Glp [Bryobacteraceae bacterium]|nr:gephyrin-like molybdotransferase Glp [Bryobacteraceae bacterium]
MPTLTFEQARACILEQVTCGTTAETVSIDDAPARVLAQDLAADRDYPPLPRSARDGFAVRAADLPGRLRVIGEAPAGVHFAGTVGPGEAVEIMTGAQMPAGADAVVMVEHTSVEGEEVIIDRSAAAGDNFTEAGAEAAAGEVVLTRGSRIGATEVALLATIGATTVPVYGRPRTAILATGDELVAIDAFPDPWQIRNSNAHALAAQVARAGGCPQILPVARDTVEAATPLIERGLESDLLLLSGGVSAGKYDIIERVLDRLGAEFFFDRVLIQPGQPLVFGRARGTFFFGLPGNPASTMVTFELFARAALEVLGGQVGPTLPITLARLTHEFRQRPGLTRFPPARLGADRPEVTPVRWSGSGDVPALCRANAFLVTDPERDYWPAGELIRVLPKR